ncbi:hypothetical protein Nmel_004863 [Mimus melanotis]
MLVGGGNYYPEENIPYLQSLTLESWIYFFLHLQYRLKRTIPALAGRGHKEEGMSATMLSTLQVISNLERD